jgi:PleD family two-component response regulator
VALAQKLRRARGRIHARPLQILLAEDSVFNLKFAVSMLTLERHTVTVANNGREAVEAFATQPFDLVSWMCKCRRWMARRRQGQFACYRKV